MCSIAAATAIISVASTAVSFAGQRQQARQQARYQAQAAAAERQRFLQEQTSLRMRQAQEQEAVGRELEQVSRKSQAALARARVAAGEAGVAGASVQALMDDYMRQEGAYRASILRQQELGAIGTGLGLEQAGFATQQRMIGLSQPIDRPSPLGALMQAGQNWWHIRPRSGLKETTGCPALQSDLPKVPSGLGQGHLRQSACWRRSTVRRTSAR